MYTKDCSAMAWKNLFQYEICGTNFLCYINMSGRFGLAV